MVIFYSHVSLPEGTLDFTVFQRLKTITFWATRNTKKNGTPSNSETSPLPCLWGYWTLDTFWRAEMVGHVLYQTLAKLNGGLYGMMGWFCFEQYSTDLVNFELLRRNYEHQQPGCFEAVKLWQNTARGQRKQRRVGCNMFSNRIPPPPKKNIPKSSRKGLSLNPIVTLSFPPTAWTNLSVAGRDPGTCLQGRCE